jgi:DNA-binding SARP family transcriptional activator/predicted ATPase
MDVTDDCGREINLGGPKQRAVLAILLLHAGELVSNDRIIDELWRDRAPRTAVKSLQVYISKLRHALGDGVLVTRAGGYMLQTDLVEVDSDRFEGLVAEGREALQAGDARSAAVRLREALELWRGPPLVDFAYEQFAQSEIARLEEARMCALEDRIDADLSRGDSSPLVAELESLVREHPLRERLRAQLMLALYRAGRHTDALETYTSARRVLVDELGIEPGRRLRERHQAILEQDPALDLPTGPSASNQLTDENARAHEREAGPGAPAGTIALLFTDIEGSTDLAARLGPVWPEVLADHETILSGAIAAQGGFVEVIEGDSFFATFADPAAAGRAALAAQRALGAHDWPLDVGELRVRMGLHVGRVERTESGLVGLEVHRAARVAAAANGGQVLLTSVARELVGEGLATESVGVHRLKDFPAPMQLFCAVIDGRGASAFPPPQAESVRPTNLPAVRLELIGRDRELLKVLDAITAEGERLVTISGRGGAGKTSLALLAGTGLLDRHPGGVWWIDLTIVGSSDEVMPAIAAVLRTDRKADGSTEGALQTRLGNSGPTLLVLDNMEHVRDAGEALCMLLRELPDLRLLVTSRLPLRVAPERVIQLDALDEEAALELIDRSIRRRGPRAKLTDADRDALRDVVRLLDGLPLALELAAARLSVLTSVQLRDRLRASIDVLRETRGDRPARQRSVRAALDSSLSLLGLSARALFVRLGVYAGPVELEELERVLSGAPVDVLEALEELFDAALVQRTESGDGLVRIGLTEALRQIAAKMLDSDTDGQHWRRAHAQRQCELVWAARHSSVDRRTYVAAVSAENETAVALRWAIASRDPLQPAVAAAYARLLLYKGSVRDAGAISESLVASPPDDARVHYLALTTHAGYLANLGRLDESRRYADDAYAAAPDPTSRCAALIMRGICNVYGGRISEGVRDHARVTEMAREQADDPALLAGALTYEAQALIEAGRLAEAATRLDEARLVGTPVDAHILRFLDSHLGDLAIADGRPADALEPYARSLESHFADGASAQVGIDMFGVAEALASLGHVAESLEVAGAAASLMVEVGSNPTQVLGHFVHLQALEQRIGPAEAAELKERGRVADPSDRVARACRLARQHAAA